ncbi:MAG: hypothetical protein JRH15_04570 [Deltaproteobacteria bacterium]|nr:hypothetical protein [Deltaproteobacteria bacterium]
MRNFKKCLVAQVLSFSAIALFVLPLNVFAAVATQINHEPIQFFVPEKRISLSSEVTDAAGVNLVRCYFKAVGEANFVFVAMKSTGGDKYDGILPAPSKNTTAIEYLFLAVNTENKIVKTQSFIVEKKDDDQAPAWQQSSGTGDITVSTELAQAPAPPAGFSDSIVMDVVESSARFGVVAGGLYAASDVAAAAATGQAASASVSSATATGTTAAGTTAAGTTAAGATAAGATAAGAAAAGVGMSTLAIVGVGAAVAAGAAVAVSESNDDSSTHSNGDGNGGGDQEPTAECNEAVVSGADDPETHIVELGQSSGTFEFFYDTAALEDQIIVRYEGSVLFDTGCVGATGTEMLTYSGSSTQVEVEIIPNCDGGTGTFWEFTVSCPQ